MAKGVTEEGEDWLQGTHKLLQKTGPNPLGTKGEQCPPPPAPRLPAGKQHFRGSLGTGMRRLWALRGPWPKGASLCR